MRETSEKFPHFFLQHQFAFSSTTCVVPLLKERESEKRRREKEE
jgi:hypothetical protein